MRRSKKYVAYLIVLAMAFTTVPVWGNEEIPKESEVESEIVEEPIIEVPEESFDFGDDIVLDAPEIVSIENSDNAVVIIWNETADAEGYYVFKKNDSDSEFMCVAKVSANEELCWKDANVVIGAKYKYAIQAYSADKTSELSSVKDIYILRAPIIRKWTRIASDKMKLMWDIDKSVSGYEIEYSRNKDFSESAVITLDNSVNGSMEINNLSQNKYYYVRMRAYYDLSDGTVCYSEWTVFSGIKGDVTFYGNIFKKNGSVFEIRSQAKQKLYQYDVLQGICSDGKYDYYILLYKKIEKCKIVKVRRSDLKVVKVSNSLALNHGNDITYNSRTKKLIVVHYSGMPKRLSVVDPVSLKIERNIDVKIPSALEGANSSDIADIKGFSGIAYNEIRDQYVIRIGRNHNFLILNSQFKPVSLAKTTKKFDSRYQSLDATNDYVFVLQSPKPGSGKKYNTISVFDWGGEFLFNIIIKNKYELEGVYHIGNTYYAGFYHKYYITAYKYKTVKVKKKWKKVKGKWKYKYKKKKVKVKYKKLIRSNYMYKLGNIS